MINRNLTRKTTQAFHLPFRPTGFIRVWLVFCGLLWFGALAARADRYVVEPGTPGGTNAGPYTDWTIAATQIQWAVNAATNYETTWVSNGTYTLTNQITLPQPAYPFNLTLKSKNGRDVTFINGNYPNVTNRCINIVQNLNAVIDGFTITNGRAVGSGVEGGGIYTGGGAKNSVLNCTLRGNYAQARGGGISIGGTGSIVSNCIVERNIAGAGGGGIQNNSALALIANCFISSNQAGTECGGGIMDMGGATIRNCLIIRNYANSGSTTIGGAGVCCFAGNTKLSTIENCTIVSNVCDLLNAANGGGIGQRDSPTNVLIRNCIIYRNLSPNSTYANWRSDNTTSWVFSANCTYPTNGLLGIGNITNDPMFVNYNTTNLRLSASSPCINTGTNQS